jgi:hypothetical protein
MPKLPLGSHANGRTEVMTRSGQGEIDACDLEHFLCVSCNTANTASVFDGLVD